MKKRLILLGIGLFVLAGIVSCVIYFKSQTKTPPKDTSSANPVVIEEKRNVWDDPAGFTFTYDASLVVNSHPEDQENYAHVELSKLGQSGKIIVWASDTAAQTTVGWVSGQKRFSKTSTMDTTLGGQPAIKINGMQTTGVMTIGAVYDGLIFSIDAYASESASLASEFEKISDSFVFKPLETDQTGQQSAAETGTSYDEEETVE
jgi:hypothetical protein